MTNTNDILGTDELSRSITRAQVLGTDGHVAQLKLLAEIVGPLQPYLQDILRRTEVQENNVNYYRKKVTDLESSLSALLKPELEALIDYVFDNRSDSWIHTDNLTDSMVDELQSSRRVRAEIIEMIHENIDTGDIKDDIKSDIERDLEDKVNDLIAGFDFGDILDDHTGDVDSKIVKRLADEISDDHNHPLVNAILNALVVRIGKA